MCKRSNGLSRPVLIGRGLDGYLSRLSPPLCSFEGPAEGPDRRPAGHHRGRRGPGKSFGGYSEGETPLPIPNREVKPLSADGTWRETARESRSPPISPREPAHRAGSRNGRLCIPRGSAWPNARLERRDDLAARPANPLTTDAGRPRGASVGLYRPRAGTAGGQRRRVRGDQPAVEAATHGIASVAGAASGAVPQTSGLRRRR